MYIIHKNKHKNQIHNRHKMHFMVNWHHHLFVVVLLQRKKHHFIDKSTCKLHIPTSRFFIYIFSQHIWRFHEYITDRTTVLENTPKTRSYMIITIQLFVLIIFLQAKVTYFERTMTENIYKNDNTNRN